MTKSERKKAIEFAVHMANVLDIIHPDEKLPVSSLARRGRNNKLHKPLRGAQGIKLKLKMKEKTIKEKWGKVGCPVELKPFFFWPLFEAAMHCGNDW